MKKIGCFISSHGFGHATRTCAILEALSRSAELDIHIFTSVNESIFAESLHKYSYHAIQADIGFVQKDVFQIDIDETITRLEALLPHPKSLVNSLAKICQDFSLILCDISTLGIAVATKAKIRSILVENFTWDWLYNTYSDQYPKLSYYSSYLASLYQTVDYHIQTEPVCEPRQVDLLCGPIFRKIRQDPTRVREYFKCGSRKVVFITLGGNKFNPQFFNSLKEHNDFFFILSGHEKNYRLSENIQLLNQFSRQFHPDLIHCADITVFKCGYSTLAECFQVGKPTICVQRDGFAESIILETYARNYLQSSVISQADFVSGKWLEILNQINLITHNETVENGADKVADFLLNLL